MTAVYQNCRNQVVKQIALQLVDIRQSDAVSPFPAPFIIPGNLGLAKTDSREPGNGTTHGPLAILMLSHGLSDSRVGRPGSGDHQVKSFDSTKFT